MEYVTDNSETCFFFIYTLFEIESVFQASIFSGKKSESVSLALRNQFKYLKIMQTT